MSSVPLSAQDTWGVAPDGSIAVARVGEFHIEWISPDGSVTRGPAIPYDAVRIGTGEKEEFVLASSRSGGGVGISVEMTSGGAVQMSFSRMGGSGRGPREIDQYTWPDEKPPFYGGRIMVDGEGRAWLRRHVRAGADATYDVFDRRGRRVGTVTLANNKQIVGFGSDTVYAVAFDEVDLAYLERYSMPSM